MNDNILLFCGLGNPGSQYQYTRHNVGFMTVDNIFHRFVFPKFINKYNSLFSQSIIQNKKVIIIKPQTYMNKSGVAVGEVVKFYKIPIENIYVIHDDLDIICGKIKIKQGGSSGGHNGLKSIDQHIDNNYFRIRIGIGHPGNKNLVSNYVLNKFKEEEQLTINQINDKIVKNLELLLNKKLQDFLAKFSLH